MGCPKHLFGLRAVKLQQILPCLNIASILMFEVDLRVQAANVVQGENGAVNACTWMMVWKAQGMRPDATGRTRNSLN